MKRSKLFGLAISLISVFALTGCNGEPIVGPQGPQGETGERGEDGVSIVSVDLTSSDGLLDIYTITYSDGTTSNFVVTNGKDGEQGIQGIPGEDGHAPVITISSDGYWVVDGVKTNTKAQGEPGKDGTSLLTGNGVPSDGIGKNDDSYIDLSNWNYYVKENDAWVLKGNIKGLDGNDGQDGNGIASIELTSSDGNIDTYTITYDNGETTTFTVTNGVDGEQGIQGIPGEDGHTPVITIGENGNWYIDGKDTGVLAEGVQGPQGEPGKDGTDGEDGTDGLSAYEIYIKYHPEYTGSEEEWLEDLVNGNLREEYKVTFQTNGGSEIEPQYVKFGRLVTRPADDPTRTGYLFDGWYLGPELFPFNSYQVYDDITLLAHWKSMDINLTLNANGGQVEYNTKTVTYGVDYTLPTPTRANYTFDGWYFSGALCPISGTWDFSKDDITLTARWSGTKANITFASDANISVDRTPITVTYGEYFKLPVPTIKTGDVFIGWADSSDNLITDEEGYSTRPSLFKSNVTLKAVYYIPITTPSELLSLCRLEEGDKKLSMTYVLQNDLDFTGFGNESINNFEGKFDGNGYNIIGLENPLFNTVGLSSDCDKDIEIKNIKLVNFSGESFVNQVLRCNTFRIDGVTIESFVKDENDYCATKGIVNLIGDGIDGDLLRGSSINAPTKFTMNNCHIDDEFADIEGGLVYKLNRTNDVNIMNCSVYANTNKSAFISEDWHYERNNMRSEYNNNYPDINVSYCSNYGNTSNLITASAINYNYYNYYNSTDYGYSQCVSVDNILNLGDVSDALFINKANVYFDSYSEVDTDLDSTEYLIENVINFGNIGSLCKDDAASNNYNKTELVESCLRASFTITSCFNAGATTNASFNITSNVNNNYQFIPLTGIEDSGAFSITNYSQITSDFFINTIGLDPKKWDLSYINIKDEYGLPKIIY